MPWLPPAPPRLSSFFAHPPWSRAPVPHPPKAFTRQHLRHSFFWFISLGIILQTGDCANLHGAVPRTQARLTPHQHHILTPAFDPIHPSNVTVMAGQTALLQCRVKHLGDRVVSWIRQSDLAILASAGQSHTSDMRFSALHDGVPEENFLLTDSEDSGDWTLQITNVQAKDAGLYNCHVNTEPKMNWPVFLNVEAAVATISGPAELYVRSGSTISLSCIVRGPSNPPSTPHWFHDRRPIALDSPRGGISLETERTTTGMTSKLLLTKAVVQDGGNYTCAPGAAEPASVWVHVLNGEHPAAMQRGNRNGASSISRHWSFLLFLALVMNANLYIPR